MSINLHIIINSPTGHCIPLVQSLSMSFYPCVLSYLFLSLPITYLAFLS